MKKLLLCIASLLFVTLGYHNSYGQTAVPMSSQSGLTYTENFADIANWTSNFASGIGANRFKAVAVNATGTIPDGSKTTTATSTLNASSSTSTGVQKGTGTFVFLTTGTTDNSAAIAVDFLVDFTGVNAGTLSFDWAEIANGTISSSNQNRNLTLQVYTSPDGTTFTALAGASAVVTNGVTASGTVSSIQLPSALNGVSAVIRLYAYNSAPTILSPTPAGSRPKLSIDNLTVTATSTGGSPTLTTSGTLAAVSTTYGTASATPTTLTVGGSSLTNNLVVTPPSGFEVSTSVGSGYSSTVTLTPSSGTVSNTTIYLRLAAATAVGTYGSSQNVVVSSTGATSANVATAASTVSAAALSITASNVTKTQGSTLTGGAGSTAFTSSGLQNSETIGTVTITYGTGAAAGDAAGTYTGQVTPSAATGGTFTASNYSITYNPGDINVTSAVPAINSSSPTLSAQTTNYGIASTAGTFNVSGTNMTAGILVTPPSGFEVSTDNTTFTSTVTVGSSGTIASTAVYVRLKASAIAGAYSGNVALTSSGAAEVDVAIASSTVSSVAPTATTTAATSITTTTATLNGSLSDGGAATTATFEYSTSSTTVSSGSGTSVAATPSSVAAGAGSTTISASLTSLTAGTTYYYWAKGTNPASGTGAVLNFTTTFLPPVTQASNIAFASTTTTSTTISWTNGDGTSRAVFIKLGSTGTPAPVDGTTYTANTAFAAGTQIGTTGWYCVYNGTGSSVTVNGLAIGTSYQLMVDEYNGAGSGSKFITSGASNTATTLGVTPVTLAISPYTESFDNIGNTLPNGFNVVTGATASVLGTSAPASPAQVVWNNVSGAFKNLASNDGGLIQTSAQTGTNRALGIRQTGSFGDPGGSFVFQVANTTGKTSFKLNFVLQSLDNTSTRTTTWVVDYGLGTSPTSFTPITATTGTLTTGNSLFSNNAITADFGSALDNQPGPITIRISALGASTGTSNRATSAIDDFSLSWTVPSPTVSYVSPQTYLQNTAITTLIPTSTWIDTPGFSTAAIGSAFAQPAGVAMDASGNVYVADAGASSVYKMSSTGTGVTAVGSGIAGLGAIALDASGNMYVTEVTTGKLKKVTTGGTVSDITTFTQPTGVVLDASGNIYVADQVTNNVSKILFGSTSASVIASGFSTPYGLAIDASGNLYVANQGNGKLQKIDATTHAVTDIVTIAPGLTGLTMDGAGNLYYTNIANHTVNEILNGTTSSVSLSSGFTTPAGLVTDATGNVYVADATPGGSVKKVARTGGYYITPALPAGLSMDGTTGAINGTPTVASTATNYTVTAFNSGGNTSATVNITVTAQPVIGTTGALNALTTTYGTASSSGIFNVSGANLTAGILVTPPAGFEVSKDNITFSSTVTIGAAGTVASTPVYIRLAATDALASTYSGNVVLTSSGANTVNVATATSSVTAAPLTITANGVSKTVGTAITGGAGSTAFTSSGLKNLETIGSVTITYGSGSAAGDPVNTYTGSVVPSAATGGTFTASNYTITYQAGDITVTAAPTPTISSTGTLSALTTTYGTASASGTFNVSGANMTAGILITPPSGFEVSTNNSTFSPSVTVGAAGTISSTPVYIRLVAVSPATTYSGNVVLTSSGAINVNVATATSTINPAPITIAAKAVSKTYGQTLTNGTVLTTAFTVTGTLKNGETITGATITYGSGALATDAVNIYTGAVVPSVATGANGFSASNYNITYTNNNIVVNAAPLTVTASTANKTYGAALTGAAGSTAFTSTGLLNSETIGSVTVAYGTGSAATAAVNTYAGSVTPSVATGGTFNANNYTITYTPGDIVVGKAALNITANTANKTYGSNLIGGSGSTAFTSTGLQNSETIGTVAINYGTGSATNAAVGTYTGQVTPSFATGGTFASGNYTITYTAGNIVVGAAPLTITASAVNKTYGATLTGAAGSTAFTSTGLANSETIGSVTIAYGTGSAATAAVNTYTGSVTPSAATGGTFTASNYTITYATGNIVVSKANLSITANNVSKVYGAVLTGAAGSTAFTSTGLANSETIGSVTIAYGTGSAATAAGGSYTGSATPSAATGGTFTAGNYNITYVSGNITVTPVNLNVTVSNATKAYGTANPAFTVNYTGFINGDNAAGLATQPTVTTTATATSGVGSYTLTASGGVSTNYTFVYAGTGTLTITPVPLTITADAKTKAYNTPNPTLTATYTGFVGTDNAASLTTQPTFATTAVTASLPGNYPITVSGAASPNYTITYVAGVLTVSAGNNANLAFLTISSGSLSPGFAATTKAYTDTVTNAVDRISVTPTLSDVAANLQVNGTQVGSGNSSTFIPLSTGNNTITILVTAQDGVTKNTYTVTVYRPVAVSAITASNIMSPNGDGKNDAWVIKDINLYPNNNVNVYDRGGRVVYSKHGYTNDWTGTLRGAPLAEGTYYYTVELDPKLPIIKGYITILRTR